jgi:CheY-like chemotaxis protein/two-component sensor histidine kinase
MEQQLERAKKMEAIGVLAGGVAHDLNNILAGIVGYPELILEDLPEGSKLIEPLEAIHDSGQRATAVVADLLTVARSVANTKSDNNLNTIVTEYLSSPEYLKLKSTYRNISYFVDLFPELYHISCSPVHIKKCIMNLITNAVEAIEGNGRVEVTTHNESVNDEMAGKRGIHTGEFVVLQVTDTGPGIAKQNLEHIFEPFYTKKIMGRSGTGLGLAVVWNSMADHGGTVFVESSNKGTTFSLFFPALLQAVSEEEIETKEPENYRGNGEKILIIDDEPQLRNLAKHFLERFGYSIDCVSSGEEAVEYLKQKDADLLLLDMIMDPGMNGRQTFECILKIKPQQKAVVASGFSENFDVQKTIELGASAFILKPYSMAELAKVVRQTLNSDSNPD